MVFIITIPCQIFRNNYAIDSTIIPFQIIIRLDSKLDGLFKMASKLPRLHAVTLIRSGIRQPYWEKRTLDALGLTKMHKTIYHKNTPSVNGLIRAVKHLVEVKPLTIRTDIRNSPCSSMDGFITSKGEMFLSDASRIKEGVESVNPRNRLRRKDSRLWSKRKKNWKRRKYT